MKFGKYPLAVEQNNYLKKIVNVYIVYDLVAWPKILLKIFTLKNCQFGATNIVKNSDKGKWVYSGYGLAFDEGDWLSFGNGNARNVIIFGIDNSSSSYFDNLKNNFSYQVKVQLLELMKVLVHQRKNFVLILLKQIHNFV